ncbi:hypothetical protein [Colwellia sp. TT2012]|uniref:hypothetical protein n=2 Tax=Gammaproteobacteria TaxID=1236 RepID=UPI001E2D7C7F|nr:hypothetical protein [Colwellia sp. TT2012]
MISVLLHVLVLLALIYSANKQPKAIKKNKPKVTVIKSFLYTAPKVFKPKLNKAKTVTTKKNVVSKDSTDNIVTKIKPPKKAAVKKLIAENLASEQKNSKPLVAKEPVTKTLSTQVTNAVKNETSTTENKVPSVSQGSFSSYDRLTRLRNKLANQQQEQAFAELTQKRSASIMHGEPFPVPHTVVPLTRDQKHKLNTSVSNNTRITKHDNGSCTMVTEQMIGSPIEATTSYFACGESKFDTSFREHMQKVQAKLPIKR